VGTSEKIGIMGIYLRIGIVALIIQNYGTPTVVRIDLSQIKAFK
jgi:hypothetical protein